MDFFRPKKKPDALAVSWGASLVTLKMNAFINCLNGKRFPNLKLKFNIFRWTLYEVQGKFIDTLFWSNEFQ